ncbi:MAG: S41 family peptidase [Anaerovoracaceae bacterium]
MNISKKLYTLTIVVALLIGVSGTFGVMKLMASGASGKVEITAAEYGQYRAYESKYKKLESIYQTVNKNFYKDVDEDKLMEWTYRGVVAGLEDPYSAYMTKEEYADWNSAVVGEFGGIGIVFSTNDKGQLEIVSVNKNTPAEKNGMKAGDIIETIDGKMYKDSTLASKAMRGKEGTKVEIVFSRDGEKITKKMTRDTIVNQTVESKVMDGNLGYIRVSAFEEKTSGDFKKALKKMEEKKVKGLVIDLRQNGGGIVDDGVQIADMLLGKGTITYLEDQKGKRQYYKSEAGATKLPYTLLVDGHTASTSEILAAAIKDQGKKNIVGVKTYGKGVVQSTLPLEEGDALKLTTMQYFSPKGKTIHKKGIIPDYVVKADKSGKTDPQLEKAKELLK